MTTDNSKEEAQGAVDVLRHIAGVQEEFLRIAIFGDDGFGLGQKDEARRTLTWLKDMLDTYETLLGNLNELEKGE